MPRNTFWVDALLVVVTLGFYMPYWLWSRNRDLQKAHPALDLQDNLAFLAVGFGLTLLATLFAPTLAFLSATLHLAGILLFSAGVFVLLRNGEDAAATGPTLWRVPPALGGGLFAGAFAAIEAGNLIPSLLVRGPALLLLATLPVLFYYAHEDLEGVYLEAERRQIAPTAMPPA